MPVEPKPMLKNTLLIADIDKELEKEEWRGVKVGEKDLFVSACGRCCVGGKQ